MGDMLADSRVTAPSKQDEGCKTGVVMGDMLADSRVTAH